MHSTVWAENYDCGQRINDCGQIIMIVGNELWLWAKNYDCGQWIIMIVGN